MINDFTFTMFDIPKPWRTGETNVIRPTSETLCWLRLMYKKSLSKHGTEKVWEIPQNVAALAQSSNLLNDPSIW